MSARNAPHVTPERVAELGARILAAIAQACDGDRSEPIHAADRERVEADLAGMRDCWEWHSGEWEGGGYLDVFAPYFLDGLNRTARLYGVTP